MVSNVEVADLLRKIAIKQAKVFVKPGARTWNEQFAGDVRFIVDGWEIVIFNDCDDFDYVDSVISPDGRRGEFDDWYSDVEPSNLLTDEEFDSVCRVFSSAKHEVDG